MKSAANIRWIDLDATEKANKYQKFTRGQRRLWYYFEEIARTERFKKFIKEIRKKYKISAAGYAIDSDDSENGWAGPYTAAPKISILRDKKIADKFNKEIAQECKGLRLADDYWEAALYELVVWNMAIGPFGGQPMLDTCVLETPKNKKYVSTYPVVLRISPYATGKEIVDFIKNNHQYIKEIQQKYRDSVDIAVFRKKTRGVQERNDFIYENRGLPYKKLVALVGNKFPAELTSSIDEGSIGKIISLERKKRQ